ncbi:MAG: glycosyltransferase family 4 protein [Magnetococcales bacterium]|nr:glycosyltransferase family 4 protein [Magnetococcales bacterium]
MRISVVHNEYGRTSGEEIVVGRLMALLREHGHHVSPFLRSSAMIGRMPFGQIRAFFSGIYNPWSRRDFRQFLMTERPDIVHIHNLYPLISPSILLECRACSIPVVMTVHNFRLLCPNGLFMSGGRVCTACCRGREYWCLLRNCERQWPKSLGYALRNAVARRLGFFRDAVWLYATLTEFQKRWLVDSGIPEARVVVIPNMVESTAANLMSPGEVGLEVGKEPIVDGGVGGGMVEGGDQKGRGGGEGYVAFVGRVSPEKGVETLLAAARRLPSIPFRIAGEYGRMPHLPGTAPANVRFLGHLDAKGVSEVYSGARMVVQCSLCFEGFPMSVVEAMGHGRAVIGSRLGGLAEIVEDGVTGKLVEAGDETGLAAAVLDLWGRPEATARMGELGRQRVASCYSPARYFDRLERAYAKALRLGPPLWTEE